MTSDLAFQSVQFWHPLTPFVLCELQLLLSVLSSGQHVPSRHTLSGAYGVLTQTPLIIWESQYSSHLEDTYRVETEAWPIKTNTKLSWKNNNNNNDDNKIKESRPLLALRRNLVIQKHWIILECLNKHRTYSCLCVETWQNCSITISWSVVCQYSSTLDSQPCFAHVDTVLVQIWAKHTTNI